MSAKWLGLMLLALLSLLGTVAAEDRLLSTGAYPCYEQDSPLSVSNFSFVFDRNSGNVTYSVEGYSNIEVSLIAHITLVAYGREVLNERVNLCDEEINELCPIAPGRVSTTNTYAVPEYYTRDIATIAYKIPDLEGLVTIELFNADNGKNLGCFRSEISNGNSTQVDSVKFVTMGIVAAALAAAAASSIASSSAGSGGSGNGGGGAGTTAAGQGTTPTPGPAKGFHPPGFVELFHSVQGMATTGMLSVNYPSVYNSFSQNVGWSVGIISWDGLQHQIDEFRNSTGGNLQKSSITQLKQTTLIRQNETNANMYGENLIDDDDSLMRRMADLWTRDEGTATFKMGGTPTLVDDEPQKTSVSLVQGIKGYVEELSIPSTNTFMTVLIWFCIILAAVITLIMTLKLALELYSRFVKPLGKNLDNFRKRYWVHLGANLVRVVMILYGLGVLYCCFQFKQKDSWAATLLAAITLALMTLVLAGFSARIYVLAKYASREKGGLEYLFSHKPWIRKYGLFYDQFQIQYWWCFVVFLVATFGRNAFLALGYGHGMVQVVGQLVIDFGLFVFICYLQPFNTVMGNYFNMAIAVIRVISMALILTFTKELSMSKISTTATGIALIIVQAVLFCVLALLIFANFIYGFISNQRLKRKKKKEMEQYGGEKQEYEAAYETSVSNDTHVNDIESCKRLSTLSSIHYDTEMYKDRTTTTTTPSMALDYYHHQSKTPYQTHFHEDGIADDCNQLLDIKEAAEMGPDFLPPHNDFSFLDTASQKSYDHVVQEKQFM